MARSTEGVESCVNTSKGAFEDASAFEDSADGDTGFAKTVISLYSDGHFHSTAYAIISGLCQF